MARTRDVIVIGAGPAGSAAATYLARHGLDVLLLDKASFPRDKTCGDALTPRAIRELNHLEVLNEVERLAQRVNSARIIGPNQRMVRAPMPELQDAPDYMLVLRRFLLDDLLRQQAIGSGVRCQEDVNVVHIAPGSNAVEINAERAGRLVSFRAQIAIVAVGASIGLLRRIGLLTDVPEMVLAARGYFDVGLDLIQELEFHFLKSDLPGYAWIFPLGNQQANIGAGMIE
ncbi:MAG: FAD-dependent oxidoreductase, partial [Candidatus Promineifilaceae bacterium]|nr:FAD-dependent oxidoreductase [Candidatus Promineifilaceae bacterium]